jgi:hypothetical protein
MERAAPRPPLHLAVGDPGRPGQHLAGGAPGEREQQDPFRGDAGADEVGDPAGQRAGLPGAGAGHDQQRPVAVLDGAPLLGVQLVDLTPRRHPSRG